MNYKHNASGTKCPACGKTDFEVVMDLPNKTNNLHNYLRCEACKTFLANMNYYNTDTLLMEIKIDLHKIKQSLKIKD